MQAGSPQNNNDEPGGGYSSVMGTNLRTEGQAERDENTVRGALRFFLSPEGNVFREFILEEIVSFVDSSGREASEEVLMALGLNNLPMPSLFRALSPKLNSNEKNQNKQMRKLAQFLLGDFEGALAPSNSIQFSSLSGVNDNLQQSSQRVRKVLPVVREYAPQLREFAALLGVRLSEKVVSRGLNWASSRLNSRSSARAAA